MCRIDGDDYAEWSSSHTSKAAKSHTCDECRREILPGEEYTVDAGKWGGDFHSYKTCSHCLVAREWLGKVCSGWVYAEVREEMVEHFEEGCGVWVGRAAVGMRRKWQRFDGTGLMKPLTLPTEFPGGVL